MKKFLMIVLLIISILPFNGAAISKNLAMNYGNMNYGNDYSSHQDSMEKSDQDISGANDLARMGDTFGGVPFISDTDDK